MKRKLCFMALPCLFPRPLLGTVGIIVAIVLLCLVWPPVAHSQSALSVGDQVPEMVISNVINHSSSSINTAEYRGKLLILDFWATWCSPCIAMFPKSDSLNKAFVGRAFILPVTYQSKVDVMKFWSRAKRLQNIRMPIVTDDVVLNEMFPHAQLPHYVWIGKNGKVVAITGHHEVNANTIRKMLEDTVELLPVKHENKLKAYDRNLPLLFQPLGIEASDVQFQSLLTGYLEDVKSQMNVIRDDRGIRRISLTNAWAQWLLSLAWSDDSRYFTRNRIVVDVKDPSKLISNEEGPVFDRWLRNNGWSYELLLPSHLSAKAFEIMRSDMARLFPQYVCTVESQKRKVLALIRTSDKDKLRSKGGTPATTNDQFGLRLTNASIKSLHAQLNFYLQHLPTPVVDQTSYAFPVDMHLQVEITDVTQLRTALQPYDLNLIEKEAEIEVLVIRDAH
jgi:thiol-disulfide isomerase/thioredoxin